MKYDSRWFKGLRTEEEKEARIKELNSAKWAFELLEEILVKEKQPFPKDYDLTNWACKAAHVNGVNSTVDSILHLITTRG